MTYYPCVISASGMCLRWDHDHIRRDAIEIPDAREPDTRDDPDHARSAYEADRYANRM